MSTTVRRPDSKIRSTGELQELARRHLWLHFARMGDYQDADVPIIVRGDGCYVEDINGKRYLDALAGLYTVQVGYSYGEEIGQAALEQMRQLPYYSNWSIAQPAAIELAAELAAIAPGDLNRVFLVGSGSEANETAWKLARQYHLAHGRRRWKAISRKLAYHGTTMGALSINGVPQLRQPFEPLVPEVIHVANTNSYRRPAAETEAQFTAYLLDELEQEIIQAGPNTVALVVLEPVQNSGGCLVPPAGYLEGVRALCDEYEILLCADEVICGFGRLGEWLGTYRHDMRPDMISTAKGLSSGYGTLGALIASDELMEPFLEDQAMFMHGSTFGGHPTQAAIALKNIEILRREKLVERVRDNEDLFRSTLDQLASLPLVGDIRGEGYFYALELVRDKDTKETFNDEEAERLLRGFLTPRLFEAGLICRADDRGDPLIQVCPPLVAGKEEFDRIAGILGDVLSEAWIRFCE